MSLLGAIADSYVAEAPPSTGVQFVSSSASSSSTTTITKPSGLSVGDWLLVFCEENSATLTIPGFRDRGTLTLVGSNRLHILARKIDGTEGSTFTASASTNYMAIAYSGVVGTPAMIGGITGIATGVTSIPSRYRAPVDGVVVHAFAWSGNSTPTITAPAGVNDRGGWTTRTFWSLNVSDETVTAGDDNTRTATESGGSPASGAASVVLMLPSTTTVPAIVGSVTNSGNSTNARVTIPSDAQVGEVFLCAFSTVAAGGAISAGPTGFTALDGPGSNTGGAQQSNYWWGYKVLASGDPGSTVNVTSGSQVWGGAGVVLAEWNGVAVTGTMTHGTSTTLSLVGPAAGAAGKIALSGLMFSNSASHSTHAIDETTIPGVIWKADGANGSGFGGVGIAVHSVPPSGSGLAPTVTLDSSPTWETNTVLLNIG